MNFWKSADPTTTASTDDGPAKPGGLPLFEPYESPAGGWGALQATARALREQSVVLKGGKTLLSMNQPDGRLSWMRVAGSEAHELVRVLRKRRQGGGLRANQPPSHPGLLRGSHRWRTRATQ